LTIRDLRPAPGGGFFLTISSFTNDDTAFAAPYPDPLGESTWVTRTDEDGNIRWKTFIGGSAFDRAFYGSACADGGYVVCGRTESSDYDFAGRPASQPIWAAKISADGQRQWLRWYEGDIDDPPRIAATSDGGYLLVTEKSIDYGNKDALVSKYNANGEREWQRQVGGYKYVRFYDIMEDSGGNYRLVVEGENVDGIIFDGRFRDGWIVTLNHSGSIVKMKGYGGQERDWFNSITEVSKDHFLLAGNAVSADGDVVGQHSQFGPQYKDGWIMYY
jgi:hypothetical protein